MDLARKANLIGNLSLAAGLITTGLVGISAAHETYFSREGGEQIYIMEERRAMNEGERMFDGHYSMGDLGNHLILVGFGSLPLILLGSYIVDTAKRWKEEKR